METEAFENIPTKKMNCGWTTESPLTCIFQESRFGQRLVTPIEGSGISYHDPITMKNFVKMILTGKFTHKDGSESDLPDWVADDHAIGSMTDKLRAEMPDTFRGGAFCSPLYLNEHNFVTSTGKMSHHQEGYNPLEANKSSDEEGEDGKKKAKKKPAPQSEKYELSDRELAPMLLLEEAKKDGERNTWHFNFEFYDTNCRQDKQVEFFEKIMAQSSSQFKKSAPKLGKMDNDTAAVKNLHQAILVDQIIGAQRFIETAKLQIGLLNVDPDLYPDFAKKKNLESYASTDTNLLSKGKELGSIHSQCSDAFHDHVTKKAMESLPLMWMAQLHMMKAARCCGAPLTLLSGLSMMTNFDEYHFQRDQGDIGAKLPEATEKLERRLKDYYGEEKNVQVEGDDTLDDDQTSQTDSSKKKPDKRKAGF